MATKKTQTKETKADRFRRLANMRTNKVIRSLEGLGKLGGGSYESTAEQRSRIKTVLTDALTRAMDRLESKREAKEQFSL